MTIHDILVRLDNTIHGKEEYLNELRRQAPFIVPSSEYAHRMMRDIVSMNLEELRTIRADVFKAIQDADKNEA